MFNSRSHTQYTLRKALGPYRFPHPSTAGQSTQQNNISLAESAFSTTNTAAGQHESGTAGVEMPEAGSLTTHLDSPEIPSKMDVERHGEVATDMEAEEVEDYNEDLVDIRAISPTVNARIGLSTIYEDSDESSTCTNDSTDDSTATSSHRSTQTSLESWPALEDICSTYCLHHQDSISLPVPVQDLPPVQDPQPMPREMKNRHSRVPIRVQTPSHTTNSLPHHRTPAIHASTASPLHPKYQSPTPYTLAALRVNFRQSCEMRDALIRLRDGCRVGGAKWKNLDERAGRYGRKGERVGRAFEAGMERS